MVVLAEVTVHIEGQVHGRPEGEEERVVCLSLTVRSNNARFSHITATDSGPPMKPK